MGIQYFKAYTPSRRHTVISDFSELTKSKPEKKLVVSNHSSKGRKTETYTPGHIVRHDNFHQRSHQNSNMIKFGRKRPKQTVDQSQT